MGWTAGLSPGAKRLLRAPGNDRAAIALLASELSRWDESERDERGRRVGQIRLTLQVVGQARWGMLATRPDGFPSSADFEFDGRQQRLVSSIDGFYDPVSFSGTDDPLLGQHAGWCCLVALPVRDAPVLGRVGHPIGPDLTVGALASRRRIEPGERFSVLVRPGLEAAGDAATRGSRERGLGPASRRCLRQVGYSSRMSSSISRQRTWSMRPLLRSFHLWTRGPNWLEAYGSQARIANESFLRAVSPISGFQTG